MNLRILVLAVTVIFLLSCKDKQEANKPFTPANSGPAVGQGVNMDQVISMRGGILTSAQSIVPLSLIASSLGKSENEILIKDSSAKGPDASHSSCFFKWSDPSVNNAGILLQIMKNPLGDEYPDYVPKFIDSKISLGEQDIEGAKLTFKRLEGLGDSGAYSYEAGKYFWRLGDQVIMGIAFNSAHNEEDQYRIAMSIGKEMTKNYLEGS